MSLHTYGINTQSAFLERFHQFYNTVTTSLNVHAVVIIIKLHIRVSFMSVLESQRYELLTKNFVELALAV